MWQKRKPFLITIGLTLLVGLLASVLIYDRVYIYSSLLLPPLAPPSWVFPVVWSVLYGLLGIAAGRILSLPASRSRNEALSYYFLQLLINFLWPILFFRFEAYWLALALILLLFWLAVSTFLFFYPLDKPAARLLIPYLVWLAFAVYLNAGVVLLN